MWLIKSKKTGESFVWSNKPTDNFLKFVPRQVGLKTGVEHTKDDLEFSVAVDTFSVEFALASQNQDVEAGDGVLKVVDISTGTLMKEIPVKPLLEWPYSDVECKKFLGNKF